MTEDTAHEHRCGCGVVWVCHRTDCFIDECQRCWDAAIADWFGLRGYAESQPTLEPLSVLLGEETDGDHREETGK